MEEEEWKKMMGERVVVDIVSRESVVVHQV